MAQGSQHTMSMQIKIALVSHSRRPCCWTVLSVAAGPMSHCVQPHDLMHSEMQFSTVLVAFNFAPFVSYLCFTVSGTMGPIIAQ